MLFFFFFFFNPHPRMFFITFREREEGWERNTHVREKHQLVASRMSPDRASELQPRYLPWLGIEPTTFRLWDDAPTNWTTPARSAFLLSFFKVQITIIQLDYLSSYHACFPKTSSCFWKLNLHVKDEDLPLIRILMVIPKVKCFFF